MYIRVHEAWRCITIGIGQASGYPGGVGHLEGDPNRSSDTTADLNLIIRRLSS